MFSKDELKELRAETPGTAHRNHLNNAGAALMPRPVIDAVQNHLTLEAEIGGYEAATREVERCDGAYDSIARMIGASPVEIALMENATIAWQMAFHALDFAPGDRILTTRAEYAANYVSYLQKARQCGVSVETIPDDGHGACDPSALEAMLDARVKLISITHIPTNGGLVNPAAKIGAVARLNGIPYLLDACQSAGQMPIDVEELGCDFLTATGRKFLRGPRGTGFLYVRRNWLECLEPPFIDHFAAPWTATGKYELRDDARRFENWENAYALRLGLGAAADYAISIGLERIQDRAFGLANGLRSELAGISAIDVRDLGAQKCAIVSFTHESMEAKKIKELAMANGINISTSSAASTRLDSEARNLPELVRVSPHYYNTENEIDKFVKLVRSI